MKDRLSDLNIEAGKVKAVGKIFNFLTPDNFPTSGDSIFMDFGEILSDAGNKIEKLVDDFEKELIAKK